MGNKYILITLIGALGLIVGYSFAHYQLSNKISKNKEVTLDIINNCQSALKANNELVKVTNNAYNEVAACFSKINGCDMQKSAQRLDELNLQKVNIEYRLDKLTSDMDNIIQRAK